MRVTVVTHFPSPYQVELFDLVSSDCALELNLVYLHRRDPNRQWAGRSLHHDFVCLEDGSGNLDAARKKVVDADVTVFSYYAEPAAQALLHTRSASGKPWCFWGERPGFRKPEWVGRLRRRWKLAELRHSPAPIWGIGRFAVEGYKTEFGHHRAYRNVPYFADLERFEKLPLTKARPHGNLVFLFTGSLIHRKGVDLLARAFVRVARQCPRARLKILGTGELEASMTRTLQPVIDQVEFVGFKDWGELPTYYSNSDILCVPSRYDGWGMVVPEGLAAGMPVIATDRTGAAIEFLQTGRNGWLITADDEEALFASMMEAARTPGDKLSEMSRLARETVTGHSLRRGADVFIQAAREVPINWN